MPSEAPATTGAFLLGVGELRSWLLGLRPERDVQRSPERSGLFCGYVQMGGSWSVSRHSPSTITSWNVLVPVSTVPVSSERIVYFGIDDRRHSLLVCPSDR